MLLSPACFARLPVGGKLIRRSLETDRLYVAQLRLADLVKVERQRLESRSSATKGKMTFDEALSILPRAFRKKSSFGAKRVSVSTKLAA